jgi:uncharacterized membrane protein
MNKPNILKILGILLWVIGILLLVFFKTEPWNLLVVFSFVLVGSLLFNYKGADLINYENKKENTKFSLVSGCEKSLIRSCLGAIIMLSGLVVIYFGKENHLLISSIIALAVIIWGAYWSASYLKCIEAYNEPRNRNL